VYYTLNVNIPKKDLSAAKKRDLLERIERLETEQREAVFLLICEHYKSESGLDLDGLTLPYDGEKKKKGVEFDLDKLPIPLRWILYKFTLIVIKSDKNSEPRS